MRLGRYFTLSRGEETLVAGTREEVVRALYESLAPIGIEYARSAELARRAAVNAVSVWDEMRAMRAGYGYTESRDREELYRLMGTAADYHTARRGHGVLLVPMGDEWFLALMDGTEVIGVRYGSAEYVSMMLAGDDAM